MPDLREQLQQLLQGRVCLMGLGNAAYGDDGFGVRLAEALEDSKQTPAHLSYASSTRSGMAIAKLQPANQAPLGAACRLKRREPAMPLPMNPAGICSVTPCIPMGSLAQVTDPPACSVLLTELENSLGGRRGYKHAAPDGASPAALGCEMFRFPLGTDSRSGNPETPSDPNKRLSSSRPRFSAFIAGTTPERWISRVADQGYDHVIFLDAVEFGGTPGSAVLLDSDQMTARFPQASTHKLSLGLLAKLAETNGTTKAWLLGVQPDSLRPGVGLTPAVRATLELLLDLLRACLKRSSRGNEARPSPARWPDNRECLSLVTSAATRTTEVMV
jgi:hydrogenase 3 maturation protease